MDGWWLNFVKRVMACGINAVDRFRCGMTGWWFGVVYLRGKVRRIINMKKVNGFEKTLYVSDLE